MAEKNEILTPPQLSQAAEPSGAETGAAPAERRRFVEPEISYPVDVLEATSFFQGPESGVTN